jgi:hypothetical protein
MLSDLVPGLYSKLPFIYRQEYWVMEQQCAPY